MPAFTPTLRIDENAGLVRLRLEGCFSAEGSTLQDAADELVRKTLIAAMALRSQGISGLRVVGPSGMQLVAFLWELGEIAAAGGDIRERLFGPSSLAA